MCATVTNRTRVLSVDVMRGLVMVLMAIDHVRVYSGLPAGGPTPAIFFTRWITHFCAPAFVFLAGTSAFLLGRTLASRSLLARYLVTRGIVLVILELTLIRVMWTFNLDYQHYVLAGVICMLGICMMLLAGLIWLPTAAIGILGLIVIAGHNLMDLVSRETREALEGGGAFMSFLYFGGFFPLSPDGPLVAVLYSIVPWIGVMAAGYGFGAILTREPEARDRWCIIIGGAAIGWFLLLRGFNLYGDPRPWSTSGAAPVLLQFLNTTKYPASLLFLLMTLGPTIALVPLADRATGRLGSFLAVFGRVPMFYYLLHIPAIHLAAIIVSWLREGDVNPWLFGNHPMMPPPIPEGYTWSVPLLYLVFAVVIAALYIPCRWFAELKAARRSGWMSYC